MTHHTPPTNSFKRSFRLLATYLKPEWKRVLLLFVLLFTGIGLQLMQPQLLRGFLDLATDEINQTVLFGLTTLMGTAFAYLFVALFNQIMRAWATYVTQDVRWRTTNELRADLAQHCMGLDMAFHNARTAGEMISRVDEDINTLSNFLSQFIIQVLGNGVFILGVILVLFMEDWRIGLGFLVFVVLGGILLNWVIKLAVPHWRAFFEMGARLFAFIEERLAGTEDIRANGGVAYTMLGLHRTLRAQYKVEQTAFALTMLTWTATQGLFRVGTALGLGLGGYLYFEQNITIGTVYLIINYSALMQEPLRQLTQQLQDLQRAVAGANRIQDMYFTETAVSHNTTSPHQLPEGALPVTFEQVDFHYAPDNPVLQQVSFELKAGEVLGLLGRTGSGKTTITRLLFRLYEAIDGAVLVGNQPVSAYPLTHLRQKIGMVTQEVQLFNASIRDNLTFFDDRIQDAQIMEALQDLELVSWFDSLPNGLDTVLEAGGRGLSAGEGQLLAFTRVFLQDPGLVILDEASSRLDPATEFLIERAVDKLLQGRTAIIVAHRLKTVERADKILILHDGQVQEFGWRADLVTDSHSQFAQLLQTGLAEVLA